MKVLVATEKPFAAKAVEGIRKKMDAAQYELVLLEKYTEKTELLKAVADVDAIIIRSDKIDSEVIAAAKNLKIVVRAGAGYDNVDLQAATSAGVCVMNTPGQNSNAVAELIFGMLVTAIRNNYNGTAGTELKGKKMGIHAFGNVGRNAARIAQGFGMDVLAYDAFCKPEVFAEAGVEAIDSAEELYKKSDVVSVNVPLTPETREVVGHKLLDLLPEGAIVVNTARKEVINEKEMLEYLEKHPKFKFLTDIKPDNSDAIAEKCPQQYFTTPKKMGAQTSEANINAGVAAASQIVDFLENGVERFRVNK